MEVRDARSAACPAARCVGARRPVAQAHESRPAYLEITETAPGRYDVLWRTPLLSGMRLPVVLKFPDDVRNVTEPVLRELLRLARRTPLDRRRRGRLAGKRIEFVGLQATITDVLVRVQLRDGAELHDPRPAVAALDRDRGVARAAGGRERAYLIAGIEHILLGVDHLLFVLGLLLIVKDRWMLVKTVSAFTVAHSHHAGHRHARVRQRAGTAAQRRHRALASSSSAPEIVRSWRGETSLTIRHPWVVAFAFGLLHGFGFASGLTTMGLPRAEIPLALLMFNVGVEAGQLLFVVLILAPRARLPRAGSALAPLAWRRCPPTRSAPSAPSGRSSAWPSCSGQAR